MSTLMTSHRVSQILMPRLLWQYTLLKFEVHFIKTMFM